MDEQRVVRVASLALPPLGLVVIALGAFFGNVVTAGLGLATVVLGGALYVLFRGAEFAPSSMDRCGRAIGHALTTTGLLCCLAYLFASGPILVVPTVGAASVGFTVGLTTVVIQSWLFGRGSFGYALPVPTVVSFSALLSVLPASGLAFAAVTVVGGAIAVDRHASE